MAQEWSDVYYGKILAVLEINQDPRYADLVKKIQGFLEDGDTAKAEKWAKALASLLISEAGGGRPAWGNVDTTQTEIVNAIFEAVRFGIGQLEADGDPEFFADLYGDDDPYARASQAGGVDVGVAEQMERDALQRQQEAADERAENLLHMMARNLDLIADTQYDDAIGFLINLAVRGDVGLIAASEDLARRIAADRGMAAGTATDRFVDDMRIQLASQAQEAAAAWGDPESPAFPDLGNDTRHIDFGDAPGGAHDGGPGHPPDGGGAGGDGPNDAPPADPANREDLWDISTLDRDDLRSRDGDNGPDGDADPLRPPSSHYEPPHVRQQMDNQTQPELQDVEEVEAARRTAQAARAADDDEALDIAKIAAFLEKNDKEGAKAHAARAAQEMRAEGRSTEAVGAIAKRLLAAAVAQYRGQRQQTEAARALPDAVFDDPRMLRVGLAFTQAYAAGDVPGARRALTAALAVARDVAEAHGVSGNITAEQVLDNFLPDAADRDIAGPEAELRQGLTQIDDAVLHHEERRDAARRAAAEPPIVASEDLPEERRSAPRDSTGGDTAEGLDQFDLSSHIQEQFALILRALQADDPQTARRLALRLEGRLAGVAGRFGDMTAADILKQVIKKKRAIEKANGVPDPIVASADLKKDDDTESTDSSIHSLDDTDGDHRHDDDDPPAAGGAVLSLKLVNKVDWTKFVEVYSLTPEEIEALKDIATKIVRKGGDATAVVKASKELQMRAKKAKTGAKFKNGLHVAAAVEDMLVRRAENRKLTKPLKASDIPEDEDVAA